VTRSAWRGREWRNPNAEYRRNSEFQIAKIDNQTGSETKSGTGNVFY
jgi:hypothetical protein